MTHWAREGFCRGLWHALLAVVVLSGWVQLSRAQGSGLERTFPQSKATVEKVLNQMQATTAGRLPVLEGFATAADHPLERYQRGYY